MRRLFFIFVCLVVFPPFLSANHPGRFVQNKDKEKKEVDGKKLVELLEKLQKIAEENKAKLADLELKFALLKANAMALEAENALRKKQVDTLSKALRDSEKDKLALLELLAKFRAQTAEYKDLTDQLQKKNEQLAELVRKLSPKAPEKEAAEIKDPSAANPPAVKVKGEITRVSKDAKHGAGMLVTVSVGTDQGVKANHTLEVYRLKPQPEYLGRLRIVSTTDRDAIGRLIGGKSVLKVGDIVVDTVESP